MQTYSSNVERTASEFKDQAVLQLQECEMTRAHVADLLETTTATVSRWTNYTSEFHLPAFALAILPEQFSLPLLRWIVGKHGYSLTKRIPVAGTVNGTVDDECLRTHKLLSSLHDHFGNPAISKARILKDVERVREELLRVEAEIEARP